MKKTHHKVKQNMSILKATIVALCTSLLLTLVLAALGAYMIWNEALPQSAMDTLTTVLRLVSMVVGCVIAIAISAEKKAIASAITAASYTAILVFLNILILDGNFENLIFSIAMSVLAWLIAIGIFTGANRSTGKRRKIKIR